MATSRAAATNPGRRRNPRRGRSRRLATRGGRRPRRRPRPIPAASSAGSGRLASPRQASARPSPASLRQSVAGPTPPGGVMQRQSRPAPAVKAGAARLLPSSSDCTTWRRRTFDISRAESMVRGRRLAKHPMMSSHLPCGAHFQSECRPTRLRFGVHPCLNMRSVDRPPPNPRRITIEVDRPLPNPILRSSCNFSSNSNIV